MAESIENRVWWDYIQHDLKELLKQSLLLLKTAKGWEKKADSRKMDFHDYSFVVFPAAKAYEGFLKTLFLDLEFITKDQYYGKRFRVGKALNPSLDRRYRKREGVYDKIVAYCNGRVLADQLWNTWRKARNVLFHWFPKEQNVIDFDTANERVHMILDTMDLAFKECKIDRGENA